SFGTFIMKKETSEAPAAEYTGILLDHTRSTSKGVEVNDAPNGIEVKVVSETTTKTAKISYGKAWFHLLPSGTYTVYIGDSIVKDEEGNDLVFTIE
ncbi:hypothetical protein, partial [Calidifontibacillus erzurumensis]|uniref:hypothetical protein n=1 Tax=Calidifontibacillus erzurumensis TaxID=2741433 RepID=UPI0035B503D6